MIDKKYLEIFLDEANDYIEGLNRSLLALEKDYENSEIINEIFRVAHTLKSSAAFVGLEYLSKLAHRMEDLFQLIKERKIKVSTELVNLLFQCLDIIKTVVSEVPIKEDEDRESIEKFIKKIDFYISSGNYIVEGGFSKSDTEQLSENEKTILEEESKPQKETKENKNIDLKEKNEFLQLTDEELKKLSSLMHPSENAFVGFVKLDKEAPMKRMRLLLIYQKLLKFSKIFKTIPELVNADKNDEASDYNYLQFVVYGEISKSEIVRMCQIDLVEEIHLKEIEFPNRKKDSKQGISENKILTKSEAMQEREETVIKTKNIKVSSEKIDYILNNVGELVITNSGLQKIYSDLIEEIGENQLLNDLKNKIDQAIRIARELQSGIMKMRMMPVGIVFQRFHRPVRDLSLSLGKKVELIIQGEDTEVDKNIIDSLNDPLMHLVRNAIDHGIESPEERIKKGKPEVGKLYLKAYQSGNHIFIEVQDDGKGLDKEKILTKAIEKGIVKSTNQLSDQEIYELIFRPDLSTADKISNISGRGVGMNVVKQVTLEYKGSIQIHTAVNEGTSFILMFPLTLAIISTIHVKIHKEEYAFPLTDVVETIRFSPSKIISLQGKNIINLRNEIVPIYELSVLMGLPSKLQILLEKYAKKNLDTTQSNDNVEDESDEFPVVITTVGNRKVGYIVDEMVGKREIVIKSLQQNYKNIDGLIGACLLGDGSIVLILDVNSLLELSQKNTDPAIIDRNQEVIKAIEDYNTSVQNLLESSKRMKRKVYKNVLSSNNKKIEELDQPQEKVNENQLVSSLSSLKANGVNDIEQKMPTTSATITFEKPREEIQYQQEVELKKSQVISEEIIDDFKKDIERRLDIGLKIFNELADKNEEVSTLKEEDLHLSQSDYEKLYSVVNSGMVNGGLVLSQLLGVTIDVSVPEFKTMTFSEIHEIIKDQKYFIIFLETIGEFEFVLMLLFDEETGINAACELMGIPYDQRDKEKISIDDIRSVLNELTNIVGSSLLNEIANKAKMAINPSVPEFQFGNKNQILDLIDKKKHPKSKDKIIYIGVDFLKDERELLSKMFLLLPKPDLIQLINKISI